MSKITANDILKVVPVTRKTLWLWQKKYCLFPDPEKKGHPGGKGIIGYYPLWVKERCKKVYTLQKKGYTISMIKEILEKEERENSSKKILVIDSEVKFCDLFKKFFNKNEFLVESAYDAWEAGKKIEEFRPSILILDISLPGVNGLSVCKNLRSDPKTKNMKIITISPDFRYSDAEVLKAGANSFFTKPVNFEILLSLCNDFLKLPDSTSQS